MQKEKERLYNHKYWSPSDGECTLDNPIVWDNLKRYVYTTIQRTSYITKKNFAEAEDILLLVKEELSGISPVEYGNERYEPISFLCKKVASCIGREWWHYLKTYAPETFNSVRQYQADWMKKARAEGRYKDKNREYVKKQQKKLRDELSDHYIVSLVYNDLRKQTGIKYTFDEIRTQYPKLIEAKRQLVITSRAKDKNKPELTDKYLARMVRDKLARKGIVRERSSITPEEKEEMRLSILERRKRYSR